MDPPGGRRVFGSLADEMQPELTGVAGGAMLEDADGLASAARAQHPPGTELAAFPGATCAGMEQDFLRRFIDVGRNPTIRSRRSNALTMTSSHPAFERSPMQPDRSAHPQRNRFGTALRVIVADDHALLREGLKLLLNMRAGVVVVADTDNLQGLSELLARQPCDVLLLGLGLGTEALADLTMLSGICKVLLVCDGEQIEAVAAAMRAGVQGAISRRNSVDILFEAIEAVTAGQIWMPPEIRTRLAEHFRDDPRPQLTRRELDVVRHVAHGHRNAEIARLLFITEQTVKTHLGHIFHKTSVRDRVGLALYAVRLGIVSLSAQHR